MISSAFSLQLHGSRCGVKFSFYTLCRRSTWIMHWAREISCFKSYMHLPRFYLYYQDELQMEKCLMEYSLTSLFNIHLFSRVGSLSRKLFCLYCRFILFFLKVKNNATQMLNISECFYSFDLECKALSLSLSLPCADISVGNVCIGHWLFIIPRKPLNFFFLNFKGKRVVMRGQFNLLALPFVFAFDLNINFKVLYIPNYEVENNLTNALILALSWSGCFLVCPDKEVYSSQKTIMHLFKGKPELLSQHKVLILHIVKFLLLCIIRI